ncbi:unnamed protein product [Periconia digitata]|uniref:Uncharacterized protein n=1 Tax=Periconia digitata TaxID=1303443 RepID=A0A9W4UFT9_9PLEO|nr:unnamed protein product [Periconia digitata]
MPPSSSTAHTLPEQKQRILFPYTTRLLDSRDHPKTICPSEVARALSSSDLSTLDYVTWRDAMDDVRALVWEMRARGEVEVLQKGEVLEEETELEQVKGPIRVRTKID